ncbi:Alpha/Beta hydrolase protein [Trichoderma pleuroticola]
MRTPALLIFVFGLLSKAINMEPPNVRPVKLDFTRHVPHMLDLIKGTRLPSTELQTAKMGPNNTLLTGMPLLILQQLHNEWTTSFDWEKEQNSINKYHQFIAKIDGPDVHFVHEKSEDPNAIPIILLHGWPGSFLEMLPLVDLLVRDNSAKASKHTSFNVVIPSLPGFALSSPAPDGWTTSDTADIFNKLMTEVLGYKTYAVHGTDWGCVVGYDLYDRFNKTVRATHLTFLPFTPLDTEQLAAVNITLSPEEVVQENRYLEWAATGNAYFSEQATKPNTIGLSLYDNPVGQLAWIAEKIISWSDPRQGTGPSLITHNEILRHVSLYYLSQSFISSVYIYYQNPNGFTTNYTKAKTDAPLLFSNFQYNVFFWPKALVETVGNLVDYSSQEFGGHFPSLDNPPALADDIRKIGKYWHTHSS